MKNASQYREALGLTQEEAAQLLKIPKSILGMFEIGQRDLPETIKLQLITLYNLVQEQQKPVASISTKKLKEDELLKVTVKNELLENQYKQQVLERKLKQCKIRFQKSEKQIKLVHILETQVRVEDRPSQDYINVLKRKAENESKKYSVLEQTKLELKIKGLKSFCKELEKLF
ncbi:helix-turn-helix transcriptional regulator [uncultured Flavobacterium sp.]|uniref:helix-turn-helix domain-containing protein n=1 Tax=uncultured Flavobacterium sp. TaxID=165435 RepID=UPI0030ED3AE8|tara:strand:+ start:67756 stop:68274 length:519 start_codon:yes stop_codon:yes gene_type:complete